MSVILGILEIILGLIFLLLFVGSGLFLAVYIPKKLANISEAQLDKLDWAVRKTRSRLLIRIWYARWLIISIITTAAVALYLSSTPSAEMLTTVLDIISRTPFGLIIDFFRRLGGYDASTSWISQMFYIALIWAISDRLSARYNSTNIFGSEMELDVAFDDSFNWRRLFRTIVYGSPVTLYLSVVADWLNKRFPINFGLIETVYKSGTKSGNGFWGNIRGFALGALYLFLLGVAIAIVFMALTGFIKRIIDAISGFVLFVSAIAGSVVILLLLYAVFSVFKVENDNVIAVTMISAMVFVVMVANSLLMEFQAKKESESPSLNKEAIRGIYINPGLNAHCIIWLDSTSDSDNCRFIYRNGCLYQGEWHNEQPNGKGKMIFAKDKLDFFDEDVDWQKWVPNRDCIKSVYVGEWKNGKRHGKGKEVMRDGTVFVGEWRNGKRLG